MGWFLTQNRFEQEPPPLEALTAILQLTTFLEMDVARSFAIHHLAAPTLGLSAARRLSLGLGYHITDWLEPAFQELIRTPACRITVEDFTLGMPVVHLIMATQASIRCLRLAIAYNPLKPYRHDFTCKRTQCQSNWEMAWWDGLARHYLHPDLPTSPLETMEKLESNPIIGVTEACQLNAIETIKEQRVFEREDDIIEKALIALKAYVA